MAQKCKKAYSTHKEESRGRRLGCRLSRSDQSHSSMELYLAHVIPSCYRLHHHYYSGISHHVHCYRSDVALGQRLRTQPLKSFAFSLRELLKKKIGKSSNPCSERLVLLISFQVHKYWAERVRYSQGVHPSVKDIAITSDCQ